jgi:hypothetical protein
MQRVGNGRLSKLEAFMSQGLHLVFQITIAVGVLAMLVWPADMSEQAGLRGEDSDRIDAP